jgi:hypothetical protein
LIRKVVAVPASARSAGEQAAGGTAVETVSVRKVVTAVGASEMPLLEDVGVSDAVAATGGC